MTPKDIGEARKAAERLWANGDTKGRDIVIRLLAHARGVPFDFEMKIFKYWVNKRYARQ